MNWGEIFIQSFIIVIGLISIITLTQFMIVELKKDYRSNVLLILCYSGLIAASLMLASGVWFLVKELM